MNLANWSLSGDSIVILISDNIFSGSNLSAVRDFVGLTPSVPETQLLYETHQTRCQNSQISSCMLLFDIGGGGGG